MDTKKLSGAIERWNKSGDAAHLDEIERLTNGGQVLVLAAAGKIDAARTLAALRVAEQHGRTPAWAKRAAELRAQPEDEADPWTGEPLVDGDTLDDPPARWGSVTTERRLVAAAARVLHERRFLHLPELQGLTSRQVVAQVSQSTLSADWMPVAERWQRLLQSQRPDDQALVLEVRGRLVTQAPPPVIPAPPPPRPVGLAPHPWGPLDPHEAREGCVADNDGRSGCPGQRGGACAEPGQMGRCGRVVPGAAAAAVPVAASAPLVVILHAPEDAAAAQELRKALQGQMRQGLLRLWMPCDIRVGQVVAYERAQRLAAARVVVHLLSADYVATTEHEEAVVQAPGARHVPVQWRTCAVYGALARGQALPRSGVWIASLRERDGAWCEVSQEILRAVR